MDVAMLRAVIEAAPDAVIVLDAGGRITLGNAGAERLFGYRREDLPGMSVEALLPEGPPEPGSAGDWHEGIGRRRDGEHLAIEASRVALGAGLSACFVRDNSRQKLAEQERERFFDASIDMLCIADFDGYFKRLNPAWERTLGHTAEELMAEPYLHFVHPDDHEATLAEVGKLLSGGDTVAFENRYRCKDGSYKWILWSSTPFLHQNRIFAVAYDITDRKRAEEQLRQQNLRLQEIARSERQAHEALKLAEVQLVQNEKLSALGQMVAGVAHEINNPLAYVINNVAVMRRDLEDLRELLGLYQGAEDRLAEHCPEVLTRIRDLSQQFNLPELLENTDGLIARTREGLRRIQGIVANLRNFARLDEADFEQVDLNESLRATASLISARAKQQGVDLVSDLADLPRITCNPRQINQVVLNLLGNALDACSKGGKITLRSRPAADQGVEIHVHDTGTGIDPAILGKVFDPFFTTKPIGKGTGLGLSISYGIVRMHGGTIDVESTPGLGTHFTVRLPREPAPAAAPTSPLLPFRQQRVV